MIRGMLALVATFAASAGLVVAINSCDYGDCNCLSTPARPQAQAPLPGLQLSSYDSAGNAAPLPVAPEDGTIEVTGNSVEISYRQAGVTHNVVYDVVGPR